MAPLGPPSKVLECGRRGTAVARPYRDCAIVTKSEQVDDAPQTLVKYALSDLTSRQNQRFQISNPVGATRETLVAQALRRIAGTEAGRMSHFCHIGWPWP
jgi:hypothetical protein